MKAAGGGEASHAVFSIFVEHASSNWCRIPISRACTAWTQVQKPRMTCARAHDNNEKMGVPEVCIGFRHTHR